MTARRRDSSCHLSSDPYTMNPHLRQDIPPCVKRDLSHFKQRFNWDCGVTCVLMVLSDHDRACFLTNFEQICKEEGFNHSTWTIDLCYLLRRFNVLHNYYTTTLGVHPGYRGHTYYDKILNEDESRINKRFMAARSEKIYVERASLSTYHLINHLLHYGPIILLINANLLTCDICKVNKLSLELRSCFPWPVHYAGHYIVLCGYNGFKQKFLYRNPSFKDRLCAISYHNLNIARKSYGTDEDVILVFNDNRNV